MVNDDLKESSGKEAWSETLKTPSDLSAYPVALDT